MDKEYDKRIGHNIRRLRVWRKLTQEELSARLQVRGCDITRSALAKIETGQRHRCPDQILTLKGAFDIPFDEIFYDVRS